MANRIRICSFFVFLLLCGIRGSGFSQEALKPEEGFRDCHECPEMVVVPAGKFIMGRADPDLYATLWNDNEEPAHEVSISKPLAISRFEITRTQFKEFTKTNPGAGGRCEVWHVGTDKLGTYKYDPKKGWSDPGFSQEDDHPVVCVSFDSANRYTRWLSGRTGKNYRLLSEAEWEYAARAGSNEEFVWRRGFASKACELGNFSDQSFGRWNNGHLVGFNCDDGYANTSPVGKFARNGFGLNDMIGNVKEWVQDCWNKSYAGAPNDGSAWLTGDCRRHVVRGGSWFGDLSRKTSFVYRAQEWTNKNAGFIHVGLRVAREVQQ